MENQYIDREERKKQPANFNQFVPPGIVSIVCLPENKAWFVHVGSCFFGARPIMQELQEGVCENQDLLHDYNKYGLQNENGEYNFDIGFEVCDWKLENNKELIAKTLADCKKTWPGSFY